MLTAIEEAALARITERIDAVRVVGTLKGEATQLAKPSVAVACLEGSFERITDTRWKQQATVAALITFKDLRGEEARRRGINPIIQAVIGLLIGQKLGLAITPLKPLRFRDVTTAEQDREGKIVYLIQFGTTFTLEQQTDEAVTDLLRIGLEYYLEPGDATADAADLVTLQGD